MEKLEKNKLLKSVCKGLIIAIFITVLLTAILFKILDIDLVEESKVEEIEQEQEQEQIEEQPKYWYSDIGRYSLEYYSKNIAKAYCNYPDTFSMTSNVKIEFLDEPNIRTSGSFKCANAFGVYESYRFVIQFKYNASSESFTLVSCNIY